MPVPADTGVEVPLAPDVDELPTCATATSPFAAAALAAAAAAAAAAFAAAFALAVAFGTLAWAPGAWTMAALTSRRGFNAKRFVMSASSSLPLSCVSGISWIAGAGSDTWERRANGVLRRFGLF